MTKPKRGLGKGLEALFADNDTADVSVSTLSISEIEPNSEQPRRDFAPEAIDALAASIKEHGVLQPLVVRPRPNGRYQIVAGERRWRAARIAGLFELPVVIRDLTDEQTYEVALVENLVRADLNPIEEAMGYRTLLDRFSMTQERIAQRVGRSRPAVANALRLLTLPDEAITLLRQGELSTGHARALLPLDPIPAMELARRVVAQRLSVRQTEEAVRLLQKRPEPKREAAAPTLYREMELALGEVLSRRVRVTEKSKGKGELTIEFYSEQELRDFAARLERGEPKS